MNDQTYHSDWVECRLADEPREDGWRGCWLFGPDAADQTRPAAQMSPEDCHSCRVPILITAVLSCEAHRNGGPGEVAADALDKALEALR